MNKTRAKTLVRDGKGFVSHICVCEGTSGQLVRIQMIACERPIPTIIRSPIYLDVLHSHDSAVSNLV